jgi:hypothetical protein
MSGHENIDEQCTFVWRLDHKNEPRPQKWYGPLFFGDHNELRRYIVAVKKLTPAEAGEKLDVLAERYPVHLCDPV